ncbi:Alpha/Beta hydrolase protein [Fomitopsis serialis]|uniref:Alpha/Beta hydrolase protein n=1 Tax=Fomitopsis serialis TaxID=139415 RepID=UPI002008EA9F|nr:Alpha/Beta hydrolase protein [Neoantrodia serialis]KAH9916865.1 Alpha/Beta hydrolase protein [Neoantrodia serialis]
MQAITYSRVTDIKFDLDVPSNVTGALPAVVYIHGGGLVAGSRDEPGSAGVASFVRRFALARGYLFISTDYRLIWPSTGLDLIDDMKTLFAFIAKARIYARPKPIALVSIFGAGGAMLSDFWVTPKGADMHMPFPVPRIPSGPPPAPLAGAAIKIRANGAITDDEGRVNLLFYGGARARWSTTSLARGSLSHSARCLSPSAPASAILEAHVDESFPPTYFVHGEKDGIVLPEESRATHTRLREIGIRTELEIIPDGTHGLMAKTVPPTLTPDAQEAYERGSSWRTRYAATQHKRPPLGVIIVQ